jgi:hypothetical protein
LDSKVYRTVTTVIEYNQAGELLSKSENTCIEEPVNRRRWPTGFTVPARTKADPGEIETAPETSKAYRQ